MTTPSDPPSPGIDDSLPDPRPASARLYVLRLTSGLLYIGVSTDIESRWAEHVAGKASRITSDDRPQGIVYRELFASLGEARTRECQLKRWARAKKEALVACRLNALRRLSRGRLAEEKYGAYA